jgi:glycerophosphoryl diester phosphodiesterase
MANREIMMKLPRWSYPACCAHRGAGLLAPENTLAAIRHGAALGYRMAEFDVKLSADGVLVLMHDATLARTTDGRGRVAAASYGELARLDAGSWHSPAFAGEAIPTLARVAAWLRANGCLANIEIKPCPGRERETGAAAALEARALWAGAKVPPLLSSFSDEALAAAALVAPELPRALLMVEPGADWLERARALGCVAIDVHHERIDAALIAAAHAHRLKVIAYTVNDPLRAQRLFADGLDLLITDAIDRIVFERRPKRA